jgi:aryl-alcohol dehydrogenase-like predicted oxidoreductase
MKYVRFGNTGMEVSRLCLGGMMFSRVIDADGTRKIVDEALEHGVNFIDTAESYTDSEDFLGRALEGRREKVYLATKCYTKRARAGRCGRNSRINLLFSIEHSLRQLRTDHVDLYQLHHPDPTTHIDETLTTLDLIVKQGKARHVGATNHYAWQTAYMMSLAKSNGWEPIVSLQARYNILDRVVESETLPMTKRFNLAFMAYGPLCGGMLTGKYAHGQATPAGARAERDEKLQRRLGDDRAFDVIDRLKQIAEREGLALNQLAILWLMFDPYITCTIIGGSKPEHFRSIYEIADRELSEASMREIDDLSRAFCYREFENQPVRGGPPVWGRD